MTKKRTHVMLAASLAVLAAAALAQVIEEEELREQELAAAPRFGDALDDERMTALFAAAEELFFNADDPGPVLDALDRLLATIEERRSSGELSPTVRGLLVRALAYRAELRHELGNADATADLGRMLEIDPGAELVGDFYSADLLRRFARIREERLGRLEIKADPPDMDLRIDGREIALARPAPPPQGPAMPLGQRPPEAVEQAAAEPLETVVTLLAGIRLLEASRPGYAPLAQEVEVEAGREKPLPVVLERNSAVLRLHTRPPGAGVTVDGVPYGETTGVAGEGFRFGGVYGREEFSREKVVPDVQPGLRVIEVRKPGYRPFRAELMIAGLDDYAMPPVVLDQERGTLVFRELPAGAELTVDGGPVRLAAGGRLDLPPGEHLVQVTEGRSRMFSTRLRLADRQTIEVPVRLRPGLAFLGVLGAGDDDLARAVRLGLEGSERWSLLDRSQEAAEVLARAGVTVESARRAAAGDAAAVDWTRAQTAVDAQAPGLVYVLAVLGDDLLSSAADVWIWAAAPGPARPDRLRLDLARPAEIDRLRAAFHGSLRLRRAWLGGLVLTSDASPHPVIADVTPGGPLEATGVRPGDQIVSISKVPVFTGADVETRLLAAETGETVEVGLHTPGGTQSVRLTLGSSPNLYSRPLPDFPDAIAFTELRLAAESPRPDEAWVIRLNQALILLRSGDAEGAVRLLREVEAPRNPNGVGRATADYCLGLALTQAGASYRDAAIEAFRRAAAVPGARLDHHDGPWVAPRAQARLLALGAGP